MYGVSTTGTTVLGAGPVGPKGAAHNAKYVASGATGAPAALTAGQQLRDAATWVIFLTHAAALAAPILYGVSWSDVALVALTYNLRMFGEHCTALAFAAAVPVWLIVAACGVLCESSERP